MPFVWPFDDISKLKSFYSNSFELNNALLICKFMVVQQRSNFFAVYSPIKAESVPESNNTLVMTVLCPFLNFMASICKYTLESQFPLTFLLWVLSVG